MDSDQISWVAWAIFIIGSIIISALQEKKKEKEAAGNKQPDEAAQRRSSNSQHLQHNSPSLSVMEAPRKPQKEKVRTPTYIPHSAIEEGQRVTTDSHPTPLSEESKPSAAERIGLKDKDSLRRAIILSDILPPKY